jgi:site-specific recombinase XerD
MKVHGKGNKERLVPLGNISKRYIFEYMKVCPFDSLYLFVSRRGDIVSPNSLKQMVSKIGKKLPFEFSCHKLRHNFATNYCLDQYRFNGNIDIYSLMSIMGHENVKTTERYLHFATQIIASENHISHLDKIKVLSD